MAGRKRSRKELDGPERWKLWRDSLSGSDCNSIVNQVVWMTYDMTFFLVLNDARKRVRDGEAPGGGWAFHSFLHRCFFDRQLLAIRRLVDTYKLDEKNAVFSLTGLLDDMVKNVHLLTRKRLMEEARLEYDVEAVKRRREEYCRQRREIGRGRAQIYKIPSNLVWESIDMRHKLLDCWCGVPAGQREPNDCVPKSRLENLKKRLEGKCEKIRNVVNKQIAHAATPDSRASLSPDQMKVTLECLTDAHECICKTTEFLVQLITCIYEHLVLTDLHNDFFEHAGTPLFDLDDPDELRNLWRGYEDRIASWCNCTPEELGALLE